MILSRTELQRRVKDGMVIRERGLPQIDEVSICLHLDSAIRIYEASTEKPIVPPMELKTRSIPLDPATGYILPPRGAILGCSYETVHMPLDCIGFIQTKGSLARGFIFAHACDGQIDPGYSGKVTFEIMNFSDFYYRLNPGIPFATMFVHKIEPALEPGHGYCGRYQNSGEPTPMRPPRKR